MKYFLLIFGFCLALSGAESEKKLDINKPHKIIDHEDLSDKEKKYQSYLKQLEDENQQLEDDGFCSCNNN